MNTLQLGDKQIYEWLPADNKFSRNLLFTHANGVAAHTYKNLLQHIADALHVRVFCYDIRAMGLSKLSSAPAYRDGKTAIWKHLVKDLEDHFDAINAHYDLRAADWILMGHSLGGWLSLPAASELHIKDVWLLDIPILSVKTSFLWTLACLINERSRHPLGRVARRRKEQYASRDKALLSFRKNPFFKVWTKEMIDLYIDSNYALDSNGTLHLRHTAKWEADVFEAMPANASSAFLAIPKYVRSHMRLAVLVGTKSEVCRADAGHFVGLFFKQLEWIEIRGGTHMYPLEMEDELVEIMVETFSARIQSHSPPLQLQHR